MEFFRFLYISRISHPIGAKDAFRGVFREKMMGAKRGSNSKIRRKGEGKELIIK